MDDKRNIFVDIGIALAIIAFLVALCLLIGARPQDGGNSALSVGSRMARAEAGGNCVAGPSVRAPKGS